MITEKKAANAMGTNTAFHAIVALSKGQGGFAEPTTLFSARNATHPYTLRTSWPVDTSGFVSSLRRRSSTHNKANNDDLEPPVPTWQQGVRRKARTPRGNHKGNKDEAGKVAASLGQAMPFVPEIGNEEIDYCCLEDDHEDEDLEMLLYRVPIFDPFEGELCDNVTNIDLHEVKMRSEHASPNCDELDGFQGLILPSDLELAEFAADVENMLGKGLDEDCSDIKGLGLLDEAKQEEELGIGEMKKNNKLVKVEEDDHHSLMECEFNPTMLDWNLDYDDESAAVLLGVSCTSTDEEEEEKKMKTKICLRLNHEAVISAWASKGSPWTTGVKPEMNSDDGWPDCMGAWATHQVMTLQGHGDSIEASYKMGIRGDNAEPRPGREARVSRYREKRRTRLFSKKIRYEVRKLNAEKRPRMKGRFVKRTSVQMGIGTTSSNANANANANATISASNAPHYQQHRR